MRSNSDINNTNGDENSKSYKHDNQFKIVTKNNTNSHKYSNNVMNFDKRVISCTSRVYRHNIQYRTIEWSTVKVMLI